MATANLTDATIEYLFSDEEKILARQLDQLHIMWYQTKYAQIWKMRNSETIPTEPSKYEEYFKAITYIDGQLAMLQQIMGEHSAAVTELKAKAMAQEESRKRTEEELAQRAAKLVHS